MGAMRGFAAVRLVPSLLCLTLAGMLNASHARAGEVETVERVKVFDFKAVAKAKVRFTIGTEGGGGVRCALWYETVSPNGDGKIIYKELERFEFHGKNADKTFGPYTMPKGPGKFSLCPGWGGIVVHIRVEVADPAGEGKYKAFEKRVDGKVKFTSEGG